MLKVPIFTRLFFDLVALKHTVNEVLKEKGQPPLGDVYRACPGPRLEISGNPKLTLYLQNLDTRQEVAIITTAYGYTRKEEYLVVVKDANPYCI